MGNVNGRGFEIPTGIPINLAGEADVYAVEGFGNAARRLAFVASQCGFSVEVNYRFSRIEVFHQNGLFHLYYDTIGLTEAVKKHNADFNDPCHTVIYRRPTQETLDLARAIVAGWKMSDVLEYAMAHYIDTREYPPVADSEQMASVDAYNREGVAAYIAGRPDLRRVQAKQDPSPQLAKMPAPAAGLRPGVVVEHHNKTFSVEWPEHHFSLMPNEQTARACANIKDLYDIAYMVQMWEDSTDDHHADVRKVYGIPDNINVYDFIRDRRRAVLYRIHAGH